MAEGGTELKYSLTFQDVIEILRLVDAGSFGELRLEVDGLDLSVVCRREGDAEGDRERATDVAEPVAAAAGDAPAAPAVPRDAPAEPPPGDAPAGSPPADDVVPAGGVPLRAPLAGIFYTAPSPGAPPFVEVGASVGEGERVGLIEVMKLFTPVVATCSGVVSEIRAQNEQLVHSGQILAIIVPSES